MLHLVRILGGVADSLPQRMARGSVWVFASYGLGQVLALVRSMILARLLVPADFGLMGLASLSTAALLIFTETGIWPALIQRKELDRGTLNTAWIIFGFRGLGVGLLIVLLAPWISRFFQEPLLAPVLRALALTFVLSGFNSLGPILLQRELEFRPLTLLTVAVGVANLCFAATAAWVLRSVWAFVVGELAGSLVGLAMSYAVHRHRPRIAFNRERAKQLLGFGRYMTAAGIVSYLTTQGDDAYVGKFLGTEPLGFYGMAYRLSNLPATGVAHVLNRVTLPAFSTVQNDLPYLRSLYLRTLRLTALVSFPLAGGMLALAPYLVGVLYGSQWLPAVPAFMVLCLFGLERSVGSVAGPVILALGRPKLVLRLGLLKLVVMAACIVPLTAHVGVVGTSVAVTLSAIAIQSAVIPLVARLLDTSWLEILKPLSRPLLGTVLMVLVLLLVRALLAWPERLWALLTLTAAGVVVYAGFIAVVDREFLLQVKGRLADWSRADQVPGQLG